MAYFFIVVLPIAIFCFAVFKWLTHTPDNIRCVNPEAPIYMRRYVKIKKSKKQKKREFHEMG